MIIKVKNCKNCPFIEYDDYVANCLAPVEIHLGKYKVDTYFKNYKSPKWCPLKKNNRLIIKHI